MERFVQNLEINFEKLSKKLETTELLWDANAKEETEIMIRELLGEASMILQWWEYLSNDNYKSTIIKKSLTK